jgi:hypothetical protein
MPTILKFALWNEEKHERLQDSRYPGRDSKEEHAKYKLEFLPLCQI